MRRGIAGMVGALVVASVLLPGPAVAATPSSCGGANDSSFTHHQVITGEFGTSLQGGYVMVPFDVPSGTTAVRVRYCYDQPDLQVPSSPVPINNTLDLGIYDSRPGPGTAWTKDQFRGWAGSSARDVTVSPNGFSDDATYKASPKGHVHGRTTRGYVPGPIPAGQWAAELGVASVVPQIQGNLDGKVAWRVEVDTSDSPDWSDHPYQPTPYDSTPANPNPGWYAGDFHVHGEEELGNTLMHETADYAFNSPANGGAGLDFITLVDHNNIDSYNEIGRIQPDYPGKLIDRSTEVTTYRGHLQNHASGAFVDYRTGPVYELNGNGSVTQMRAARPASAVFDAIHAAGGYTQINHPTIFPSAVPGFSAFCRGCPWDYSDAETDYSKVDAIEVSTGPAGLVLPPVSPGPNPFTPLALQFYEHALGLGDHIAAVGGSDSHHAGDTGSGLDPLTTSPDGVPTTEVYADQLSEKGIQHAVEAGHTYVKLYGGTGPDLRFEAKPAGSGGPPAIMGDTVHADSVDFKAEVLGAGSAAPRPGPYVLLVFKDGLPYLAAPVTGADFNLNFSSLGAGRYRLQVMRLSGVAAIEDVSSPIYVEPPGPPAPPAESADLSVHQSDTGDPALQGNRVTYTATVHNSGPDPAEDVELGDVLPQGFGFISAMPETGSCSETSNVVNCDLGGLASGADVKVRIATTADRVGKAGNVAIVHSATFDPEGDDNSSTEASRVYARGACANRLVGDNHANRLTGSFAGDLIIGHRGHDVIKGGAGHDCLNGNRGNDRIYAVDGKRDLVTCGRGHRDYTRIDSHDVVRGCEHIRRG